MKTKKKTKEVEFKLPDNLKNSKTSVKDYNHTKHHKFVSIDKIKEWFKNRFRKGRIFLIIMYHRNNKYKLFTVAPTKSSFEYAGGTYFIDPDMAKLDLHTGLSMLFYHQDSSVPFKIQFDMDKLLKAVAKSDKGIALALNPNSLKGFINSQVIEKVLKGTELTDDMAFMKKLIIINLLITVAVGFGILKSMGII